MIADKTPQRTDVTSARLHPMPGGIGSAGRKGGGKLICGIAGFYTRGKGPIGVAQISAQCDTIVHRGPDHEGIMVDGDFGFGMRRLSIIDIAGSNQPVHSPDRRHALIFNGEIYNFQALRGELIAQGYSFETDGDAEVILAGHIVWGEAVWDRLDGMFAVALWDRHDRSLTLARDRTGIKPLYYTDQPSAFAFASELKALMPCAGLDFDIDCRALHDYVSFGHIRSPRSIYRQVSTLAPGHVLTLRGTGAPLLHCFWRPEYRQTGPLSEAAWIDRFRQTWLETVRGQMIADVDVGAFLSGGVDSSAVVAAMARASGRPVKTFTIGFPEPRFDESGHAERVARHLGCDHHVQTVNLAKARDLLPVIQRCYDEPMADTSAIPVWYVSQMAAGHVKVMLSGDGGDEMFFGYKRHQTERQVGRLPKAVRGAARGFAEWPALPWTAGAETYQRWQKTARGAGLPSGVARFFSKTQITSPALRRALFAGTWLDDCDGDEALQAQADEYFPDPAALSRDPVEQFALCDLMLNLPGKMLTKVDRASMAHSIEVRVPMLGNAMIDLALSMPASIKLRRGVGKYIVRQAIGPWLPPGTLDRRKQGFKMPLNDWFAGDLNDHVRELWHDSGLARSGYIDPAAFDRILDEQRRGRRDHGRLLYAIAILALWWQSEADRRNAARAISPA